MNDLFGDEPTAKQERDVALAQVGANAGTWLGMALMRLRIYQSGTEGTAEQFRLWLLRDGLPAPHHHNAWGAMIKRAQDKNILRKTGKHAHMSTRKSHARMTPVLVRIGDSVTTAPRELSAPVVVNLHDPRG